MNKLGFHVNALNERVFDAILKVRPKFIKTLDHNMQFWKRVKQVVPEVMIVGRHYVKHQEFLDNPEVRGREYATDILQLEINKEHIYEGWETYNEVMPGPDAPSPSEEANFRAYDRFQVAFAEVLRQGGFEPVAMNFGTGNFLGEQWIKYFPGTLETYKYIGVHEYDWPAMWRIHRKGMQEGNGGMWLTLRYRRQMGPVRAKYGNKHTVLITECGLTQAVLQRADIGWRTELNEDEYWASLQWYNDEICRDDYVLGCAIFVVGQMAPWESFETLGPIIDRIAAIPKDTVPGQPTPPHTTEPSPPAEEPTPPSVTTPAIDVEWDTRLDELNVSLVPAQPNPGVTYWKLVKARYQDDSESGGNHNVYVHTIDAQGKPKSNVAVEVRWPRWDAPDDSVVRTTNQQGNMDVPLYAYFDPKKGQTGPYHCACQGVSDRVSGMGLPQKLHVNFILTFQETTAQVTTTPPPPTPPSQPAGTPQEQFLNARPKIRQMLGSPISGGFVAQDGNKIEFYENGALVITPTGQVSLGPVGGWLRDHYQAQGHPKFQDAPPRNTPDNRFFPDTGHNLFGIFARGWKEEYGPPVTEEFHMAVQGRGVTMQLFHYALLRHNADIDQVEQVRGWLSKMFLSLLEGGPGIELMGRLL